MKTAPASSKLVVLLVVDQLPSWTFARHLSAFRGGFGRLAKEGVVFTHARYPYAATVTGVGHTALATGAEPRRSGIVGNSWWDREAKRFVDTTEDRSHPSVPAHDGDDGASARLRLAEAVGAGKRVFSVSYKERAAVLMAPSHGAMAAWYEPKQTAFVSSTAYTATRPAWLETLAREHPVARRFDLTWTPLEATPSRALVPDSTPGEVGKYGLGTTFPHVLPKGANASLAVGATPSSSEMIVEATLAGIDAVKPELLDVSFSAHDLASHAWGQESWEATDILFRMDEAIGKLFDGLDARYGPESWSLVFSSDHGGPELPERTPGAVRVDLDDVHKAVKLAAGEGTIAAADERMVWMTESARARPDRGAVLDRVVDALKKIPGIGFAMRTDAFESNADCKDLPELETLVCRSLYTGRTGDVYYGPKERSYIMRRPFEANFHGTPYAYDREVPIVVREPGRAPRVVTDDHPSTLRVAPTVARLLAVPPPSHAKEPSL